ncbi:MAG: hypothetical protein JNK12_13885 [Acidimicrobiales bacterium]|nr:hypothetical protein [Acidimicrobiales bacterium]
MSRLLALFAFALLFAATAACTPTRAAPTSGTATVAAVSDGDTIDVDFGGDVEAVRLLGIDTSNPAKLHPSDLDRP